MLKFPYFAQHDAMDCGPTCLRMAAKYFGKTISINDLRNQSQYSREGVSLLGISKAAESIGFKTLSVQVQVKDLIAEAPLPCILHWNQNHFVVLYKATKNTFTIADPAKGIIKLSKLDFLQNWISTNGNEEQKGIALLLEPTSAFHKQEDEKNKGIGWGFINGVHP
jgi:ATP-binding cassette, subfamily B, bacterial